MKKLACIFTIVYNEDKFLPIWEKHYRKHFDLQDMFVVDDHSTDGSVDRLKCNVESMPENPAGNLFFDHLFFFEQVKNMRKKLLRDYEYVVFCDVDELIMPYHDIGIQECIEKLKRAKQEALRPCGFTVHHLKDKEPESIDWGKPILVSQRKYWHYDHGYCKPSIASVSLNIHIGAHSCDEQVRVADDLLLVHLHKVDEDYCYQRKQIRGAGNSDKPWSPLKKEGKMGWTDRALKKKEFYDFYNSHYPHNYSDCMLSPDKIELIPEVLKDRI